MNTPEPSPDRDPVERLAESFLGRYRRGERPGLTEYVERHPELADDIRDLFPALVEMEGLKTDAGGTDGWPEARGPADSEAEPPPVQLGDYRILRLLGAGGMGIVYEAERRSLRSHVALKVLLRRYRADSAFLRRFHNEARSAARLHHTNIVPVFDFGEQGGILYYAMQYIPGPGLDRVLDDVRRLRGAGVDASPDDARARTVAAGLMSGRFPAGPSPPDEPSGEATITVAPPPAAGRAAAPCPAADAPLAGSPGPGGDAAPPSSGIGSLGGSGERRYHREVARLGSQVADALAHAHARGVLHRDIKPSNLLLDARGTAWVTDFGLAKFDEGEDLTATGDLVGTLRYMAPERFEGRSDARGDVYALGATLYEMLALRSAYDDVDRARLMRRILDGAATPLRQVDARIPRDLATIVHRAMARDPRDRFATAAALRDELDRFREGRPIRSRPAPWYERAWRWCRRNPAVAGLTAAVAGLVLAVAIVSAGSAARLGRALEQSQSANAEAKANLARAQQEEANARRSASESKAVLAFFRDRILAAARPEGQEGGLGRGVSLLAAVDAAERSIAAGFADQPTVEAAIRGALGTSYFHLGEAAMAIRQQERAWSLLAAALGAGHPDTLRSLNELADAYLLAGRIAESIPRYEEALELRKAMLGHDQRETLDSMGDLAVAYYYAGRIAEAVPLAEETLRLKEAKLGHDHFRTLNTMRYLAEAYRAAGRTDEAIALYQEAIRRLRAKAAPEHPDTLRTMALLGLSYQDAGRLGEAISLGEEALKLQGAVLGPDNFVTLQSKDYLDAAYRAAGRTNEAIALHESALKGLRVKMGLDNHETLHSMNNLAGAYQDVGRLGESLRLFEEALRLRRATLGRDHPDTLKSMANLAGAYQGAGRLGESLPMLEEALKLCEAKLGLDHPFSLTAMDSLASVYLDARRWPEAEALARDVLTRRERARPDDWRRFHTMSQLGASLAGQAEYTEAEPLLIGGYEGLNARWGKMPAPAKKHLPAVAVRIVAYYEAWGKAAEAARWREKLGPAAAADGPRE